MIARAGGLDQGNIILNLVDVAKNLPQGQALYLAGSAINSIMDANGHPGRQARRASHAGSGGSVALGRSRQLDGRSARTRPGIYALAKVRKLAALQTALEQRYKS